MVMPKELIFVRHGQSEANVVQGRTPYDGDPATAMKVFERPDWQQRLSVAGIEQAKMAGKWLATHSGPLEELDEPYVLPFIRTRETALHLGGAALLRWTVDDRLIERGWGVYGKVSRAEQEKQFPRTAAEKAVNPWYIRLDGGESMADVYMRFRDFQGTLHREEANKRVLAVSHSDFMNVVRYGVERMLPEEWETLDGDRSSMIRNCSILNYSRVNPDDPEDIRGSMHWRRLVYPTDPASSPDGGNWVELPNRRRYAEDDLRVQVERFGNLL